MEESEYLMELKNIYKSFEKVQALIDVNLSIKKGEVMGLIGDNGAGKSTLMKIVSGAYIPDKGEIYLNGRRVRFANPRQAQKEGIGIIYQDLALANILSVTTNVFMGKELRRFFVFLDDKRMKILTEETLKKLKTTIKSIEQPVYELSGGQQHSVATARLLVGKPSELIIMDEPTAGLGVVESEKIINLILELKKKFITIILISHNLEHVFRVSDRITILQSGSIAGQLEGPKFDKKSVLDMMLGVA